MLKIIFPLLSFTCCTATFAASPTSEYIQFVPKNWKIIKKATGDLNHDVQDDMVLVLEQKNPANIITNTGLGSAELNTNPRSILILLKSADGYKLVSNNTQLPSEHDADSPCLADPMQEGGISISKGILKINLNYWLSCGSWYVTNNNYSFRYQNNSMTLIGFDQTEFHRASGDQTSRSVNFSTGKIKTITGENEFTETKQAVKIQWSSLKNSYPLKFDQINFNEPPEYQ